MTKEGTLFTRELRYIVVKCSDAIKYLSHQERTALETIAARCQLSRIDGGKKLLETVVVESDWPEYEPTWKAIEERMQPTPPTPAGAGTETCIACGYIATIFHKDFVTDEACGISVTVPNVEMMKCEKCGDVVVTLKGHQAIDSRITLARHLRIRDLEAELTSLRRQAEADRATIARLEEELRGERNMHGHTRVVVEELNIIANDLSNASKPQFIRSEAIRLLREEVASLRGLLASADKDRERLSLLLEALKPQERPT